MGWVDDVDRSIKLAKDMAAEGIYYDIPPGSYEEILAQVVSNQNADMIKKASGYEQEALISQADRERDMLKDEYLQSVGALFTDIENIDARTEVELGLEEAVTEAEISGYRMDYDNLLDKAATTRTIAERKAITTLETSISAIDLAYDITAGRAELDLNTDILAAELVANETIDQAILETKLTERKAGTIKDVKQMAAYLAADYRTETELAKSIYTAKRTVAAMQAKAGASGFTGESINLVAEDTKNFFEGQIGALRNNIAGELQLALRSSEATYNDTISAARATEKLNRMQAANRLDFTTDTAISGYDTTMDIAGATRKVDYNKAFSTWDTERLNYQDTYDVNMSIADRTLATKVEGTKSLHEGRVDSINLEHDIIKKDRIQKVEWATDHYTKTDKFIAETVDRELEWSEWRSNMEAEIAIRGGEMTAASIREQKDTAKWQKLTTVGSFGFQALQAV